MHITLLAAALAASLACSCSFAGAAGTRDADDAGDGDGTVPLDADTDAGGDGSMPDDASGGDAPPPGAWLTGYAFRKQVTVTPPALGGALASFPVALVRSTDMDIATNARADGADIVLTSADATTVLDSELAYYESASGALEIWARVPSLPLAGTTTMYLYYGGPATPASAAAVWSSAFASVWHLSQATGATDSAGANDLEVSGTDTSPPATTGIAGLARSPAQSSDRLSVADNDTLDFASATFSFSVWVRETASVGSFDGPFYKGGTNDCCPGYGLLLGTGSWDVKIHDGGGSNNQGSDYVVATFGSQATFAGRWVHLVACVDRAAGELRAYADGALTDTTPLGTVGPLTSSVSLAVGKASGGAWFNGSIDEPRVYSVELTDAWIATEHANLASSTFLAFSTQQVP